MDMADSLIGQAMIGGSIKRQIKTKQAMLSACFESVDSLQEMFAPEDSWCSWLYVCQVCYTAFPV